MKLRLIPAIVLGLIFISCSTIPSDQAPKNLITFDDLMAKSKTQRVQWITPKGGKKFLEIVEIEIPYTEQITQKAKSYLKSVYLNHYFENMLWVEPKMIVLHSSTDGDLQSFLNRSGFLLDKINWNAGLEESFPVGAHFIVDRDGKIYCLTPPKNSSGESSYDEGTRYRVRRHVKEVNPWAIGIENLTPLIEYWEEKTTEEKVRFHGDLTIAQRKANTKLVEWLLSTHAGIQKVFGHHQFNDANFRDALQKNRNLLPVEFNPKYTTANRFDPGEKFLSKVVSSVRADGYPILTSP